MNSYANNSYAQSAPILTPSMLASLNPSLSDDKGINLKLIPATGGFILEVYKQEATYMQSNSVNRYILKEKNLGKQIEKILAIEILKK
jgi:hypothetical protein